MSRIIATLCTLGLLALAIVAWTTHERASAHADVVLFSTLQPGCPIIVPERATEAEQRAAQLLQSTLAASAGRSAGDFPIRVEALRSRGAAIHVGATRRSPSAQPPRPPRPPHDNAVHLVVEAGAAYLRADRREIIEAAASWFLEHHVGAHWFMPGPLGVHVPRRAELKLASGVVTSRPGFVSRDLGTRGEEGAEWHRRNRLEARFDHGHALNRIFRREDLVARPEMAPMRNGVRYLPRSDADYNWQPDLLQPAAVAHAAAAAVRAFDADPRRLSFSLSENDSFRFDDSLATLAAVAPPRFFRHRPDYSDLMFRFANEVAARVAPRHPDRYLPTYAYYWTENTPRFPVAKNVVPFLTADRSLWMYPEFAAEDRALIERWCRSGAEMVGVYDYFYGSPFLVPRPTLWAPGESIPFEFRAGVRAFFGEMNPNWALDGPKPWLAAQLLWSPGKNPAELLETYFREFWAEAAAPMRAFYAECDEAWRALRDPPRWIRYYEDDDQARIFPPERLRRLRAHLETASGAARTATVRERVRFVTEGFSVTEAFARFCVAREQAAAAADPVAAIAAWDGFRAARREFMAEWAAVQRAQPFAIGMQEPEIYLRWTVDGRIARALDSTPEGRARLRAEPERTLLALGATPGELEALFTRGRECLRDPQWRDLEVRPVGSSATVEWAPTGRAWNGSGEPWETRRVSLGRRDDGAGVLRFRGVRYEQIRQWVPATPDALYVARLDAYAKSSPGTSVTLLLSFLDDQQKHIGLGQHDRVVAAESAARHELCLVRRAPPNARWIGMGVIVQNQINDDFAELSGASLKMIER